MRENMGIYRGKRKDTGEWVEGNLIESDNPHYPMVLIGHVITSRDKHTNALYFDGFDLCEVDHSTVGQYTGLMDKSGKRIFDGDLVIPTNRRRLTNKPQVVEYCTLSGYWQCAPAREPVVIGNIQDNTELLEDERT